MFVRIYCFQEPSKDLYPQKFCQFKVVSFGVFTLEVFTYVDSPRDLDKNCVRHYTCSLLQSGPACRGDKETMPERTEEKRTREGSWRAIDRPLTRRGFTEASNVCRVRSLHMRRKPPVSTDSKQGECLV